MSEFQAVLNLVFVFFYEIQKKNAGIQLNRNEKLTKFGDNKKN